MLETIYITRHGFRSNWDVDPRTGEYRSNIPSPTGIPSDPALSGYGVEQSEQLGEQILRLDPPVEAVFSSPFYRCLQTLAPTMRKLKAEGRVNSLCVENGVGEFYGVARFDHPSPAPVTQLQKHFDFLDGQYEPVIVPSKNGETILDIHRRVAYALHRIIESCDHPDGPKALLICTHAATMIAAGRVLTGQLPELAEEEDFNCFTCCISKFRRRREAESQNRSENKAGTETNESRSNQTLDLPWYVQPDGKSGEVDHIPLVDWMDGKGVQGGWDCVVNGDASFLKGGPERGWRFQGDESFLSVDGALNDQVTVPVEMNTSGSIRGKETKL